MTEEIKKETPEEIAQRQAQEEAQKRELEFSWVIVGPEGSFRADLHEKVANAILTSVKVSQVELGQEGAKFLGFKLEDRCFIVGAESRSFFWANDILIRKEHLVISEQIAAKRAAEEAEKAKEEVKEEKPVKKTRKKAA